MKLILTFLVLRSFMLCNSFRSKDHTTRKRMCPDPPLPQHMIRYQTMQYEEAVEHDGMLNSGERLMFYSGDTLVYRCQDGFSARKNGPCLNHYPYLKSDQEHDPDPNPYHCPKPDPNPNPDHYPNPDPNPDPYPNPYYNNEESDETISSTLVCDDSGRWNGRTLYTLKFEECIPEPCTIPYSYDDRLSIFIRRGGSIVSLSGGVTVNVGETMYFNCINTDFENFEPNNRRFKCNNGKLLEDEKDKDWKLGYNGEFPLCRNTSCVPMCKNGGKCIRDGKCQCPHLTSGATCEDVLCDAECKNNGGTCIAPGKCGNCPKGRYGNNCEHSGCKPPVGIPEVKNNSKTFYNEGEKISSFNLFCPGGHVLFPKDDKICLNGGIWTDTAKCQKGCYLPDDTPPMEKHKDVYQTGEVIPSANFECSSGTFAKPIQRMTCLQSGNWSQKIECIPGCKLPDDILPMNQQQKPFYAIGEHIPSSDFLCSLPSVLSSENGMTCR